MAQIQAVTINGYINRVRKLNSLDKALKEFHIEDQPISIAKPVSKIDKVTIKNDVEVYA